MKNCFTKAGVKTADWWTLNQKISGVTFHNNGDANKSCVISELPYPIVAKHHFGSRGNGNYLLNSQQELQAWMKGKDLSNYLLKNSITMLESTEYMFLPMVVFIPVERC